MIRDINPIIPRKETKIQKIQFLEKSLWSQNCIDAKT